MANISWGAYHPAWREVIFPFLSDQRDIDQLWCSSKIFHSVILQRVRNFVCNVFPMDTPIRKAGVYPSYIKDMTGLRALTVRLYPRLIDTWRKFVGSIKVYYTELLSDRVPRSVTMVDVMIPLDQCIMWMGMNNIEKATKIFQWLDTFPAVRIGTEFKRLLNSALLSGMVESRWSKYQYINRIEIDRLLLLLGRAIHPTDPFFAGITTLVVPNKTRHQVDRKLPETINNYILAWDMEGGNPYVLLYQLLPNLREITGYVPILPRNITVYKVRGQDLNFNPIPKVNFQGYPMLQFLEVPWYLLDLDTSPLPNSLTKLAINDSPTPLGVSTRISRRELTILLKILPRTLKELHIYFLNSVQDNPGYHLFWTPEEIQLLPAVLHSFTCNNPIIIDSVRKLEQENAEIINALPQTLTKLDGFDIKNIHYSLLPLLPPTITVITISDIYSQYVPIPLRFDKLASIISHFTQLSELNLILDPATLQDQENVPIVLPQTLKIISIDIADPLNYRSKVNKVYLPLDKIVWPHHMERVSISCVTHEIQLHINSWNLPHSVDVLEIVDIYIDLLPQRLPHGLRSFRFDISDTPENSHNITMERLVAYLPPPSLVLLN